MAMVRTLVLMGAMATLTSGCALAVLGAAGGTGYVIADEIDERDGTLDVLENVRGVGNGAN